MKIMMKCVLVVVDLLIHRKPVVAVISLIGKIKNVLGILMVVINKSRGQTSIIKYCKLEVEFVNLCTAMTQFLPQQLVNALKTMNFS